MELCTLYQLMMIIPTFVIAIGFGWVISFACRELYKEFGWRGPAILIFGILMVASAVAGAQLYKGSCV